MAKKVKTIPWVKIKAEYLQGVTPKELAIKYKITAKQVTNKANRDKWAKEKERIQDKARENVQEKIKDLTNLALEALVEVINDIECENRDKISAAKAILDISGLKSLRQDLNIKDTPIIVDDIK